VSSFFVLCLAIILCPGSSQSQSADDIHVVPRSVPQKSPSTAVAPGADLDATLDAHLKPLRVDVDLVLVPVTITDGMNRPVLGLEKQNFSLLEDGVPQSIRFFSTEDLPVSVGVLLDLSKSMKDKIDVAREAVGEFFKVANPQDDYFVITFSDRPRLLADSTQSIGSIQSKLASTVPGGHTALLDAIYLGEVKARRGHYKRRALVIISDGGDNHSRFTANELKQFVAEEDVQIYAIGIFDKLFKTPEEWSGKRLLTQITEATGGHTITLNNPRELPQAAASISLELRNQYMLGYRPGNVASKGKWRKIKVRVTPTPTSARLQVYSRAGYLAPAE